MTFLGDEGRDVLVAREILEGHIKLLGPRSSAADFFYGPIYYYMITPFLALFNNDPVGPAVMVALIGIVTVFLVYKMGKDIFQSKFAGLVAAALYGVSPVIIAYSRSSWNPNPLPFVSLLALYLLYKGVQTKSVKLFFLIGLLLGIGIQMQYLALFLGVIIGTFTFLGSWYVLKKIDVVLLVKRYLAIFVSFLVGLSPFIAFEVRHGYPNARTILRYIFTDELKPINYEAQAPFQIIWDVLFRLFGRLITRFPPPEQVNIRENTDILFWYILTLAVIVISLFFIIKIRNRLTQLLLLIWLILGVGLFGFYKDNIYDYHFGFMFALPFLLVGNALSTLRTFRPRQFFTSVSVGCLGLLLLLNLWGNPFRFPPNRQKDQVKAISEFILSKTDGKPYNFALLTLGNSDHGYRYFFAVHGKNPVTLDNLDKDPQRESVTDQLFVVCEDPNCKPLGAPLWEVAGFGRAEIAGEWQVSVVKVYKLTHYKGTD